MTKFFLDQFEPVTSGIYLEGLSVDPDAEVVWYSDVIGGGIHRLGGGVKTLNPDRMWTGGVMLNEDGAILSSGAGGIMWNNPVTGRSGWLLDAIDGSAINGINEMVSDGAGGIFFGTCDIESVALGKEPGPTDLYRLSVDGETIKLAAGIGFCNGIMYDPVKQQLYCNDTFNCCWVFDVTPDLTLTNKRVFLDKADADGMALDQAGNVWVTGFRSSALQVVNPDGQLLCSIATPAEAITQIRFGGKDMQNVYINTVPIDGGDNLKDGEIPTGKNSIMYRARSSVAGLRLKPSKFHLD